MAKIVIAELDIDVQAMIASTSQVKKSIDDLKKSQKELTENGDGASKAFVQNAGNLKLLSAEYNAGVKALSDNSKATQDNANRTEMLALAFDREVNSIAEAREQNKLLTKLRNETNLSTKEGEIEVKALNKALDVNNDFIKENADAYLKQKINIGNYSDSMKEAFQSINPLNGGITGLISRSNEAGGAGNLLKSSLQGVTTGIGGMIKSSLAFIATPIGAVIAIISGAALILYNVFKTFQPVIDKVEQGMSALSSVINVVKNTVVALVTGATSLKEAFSGLGGSMSRAADEAMKLTKAQQDLDDAQEHQEVTTARNRAEINKLNVQLKDRTKTEAERLKISDQIIKKEQEDFKERKVLADEEIRIARGRISEKAQFTKQEIKLLKEQGDGTKELAESRGGNYDEEFKALNSARIKAINLENEVSVNIEKQYVKRNKIEDEAQANSDRSQAQAQASREKSQAAAAKSIDDSISKSKTELDFFIESQGTKAKSLADELKLAEQVRDKKIDILKTELANGKITQSEFNLESLKEKNSFLKKQADITVANADKELAVFIEGNKSKLDKNKFVTNELYNQELDRLNRISEAEATAATTKLIAGVINAEEYNKAIKEIDEKAKADQQVIADAKIAADLEKNAIDLDNKIAANENEFIQKQLDLDRARQQELDNAEKTGADKSLIEQKYAVFQKKLDEEVNAAKLKGISDVLGSTLGLLKENTLLYKSLAIAKATIDTITGAQLAYNSALSVPVIGTVLAPIASGLAYAAGALNVGKIAGVKFEQGGIQEVGGNRHSAGGTKFYGEDGTMFEAEKGEGIGVLNRGAFASFMDFNNSHGNGTSTPTFMAGGGIITQGVRSQSNGIDIDSLMQAISSLPTPVVAVTDIHTVSDNYVKVVNGANF
jgi:hypothetical protein